MRMGIQKRKLFGQTAAKFVNDEEDNIMLLNERGKYFCSWENSSESLEFLKT